MRQYIDIKKWHFNIKCFWTRSSELKQSCSFSHENEYLFHHQTFKSINVQNTDDIESAGAEASCGDVRSLRSCMFESRLRPFCSTHGEHAPFFLTVRTASGCGLEPLRPRYSDRSLITQIGSTEFPRLGQEKLAQICLRRSDGRRTNTEKTPEDFSKIQKENVGSFIFYDKEFRERAAVPPHLHLNLLCRDVVSRVTLNYPMWGQSYWWALRASTAWHFISERSGRRRCWLDKLQVH